MLLTSGRNSNDNNNQEQLELNDPEFFQKLVDSDLNPSVEDEDLNTYVRMPYDVLNAKYWTDKVVTTKQRMWMQKTFQFYQKDVKADEMSILGLQQVRASISYTYQKMEGNQ